MSRASQHKRAARAKDRARQRAHDKQRAQTSGAGSNGFAHDGREMFTGGPANSPFGTPRQQAPRRLSTRHLLDDARSGAPQDPLVRVAATIAPASFLADTEVVLITWTAELYGNGWQPTELVRFVRLQGSRAGVGLIELAMWAERTAREGPTATDPRWVEQWQAVGLPARPIAPGWVHEWAGGSTRDVVFSEIFELAALLGTAPRLELLLPPPPGVRHAPPAVSGPSSGSTDPMLARVRALLAKAESTEHESEAMAFTAKAQGLITKHAIDLAALHSEQPVTESPQLVRLTLDPPYADAKALLLQTLAEQTRCRTVFHATLALSSVIGYPIDLKGVELLFTSLLVQAQHGLAEASAIAPPGSRARSQSFRAAFLRGFTERIGERLAEANRLAYANADAGTFLPVLRSKGALIDGFVTEHFGDTVARTVRGGFDGHGYARGQLAGDRAALTAGPLTT